MRPTPFKGNPRENLGDFRPVFRPLISGNTPLFLTAGNFSGSLWGPSIVISSRALRCREHYLTSFWTNLNHLMSWRHSHLRTYCVVDYKCLIHIASLRLRQGSRSNHQPRLTSKYLNQELLLKRRFQTYTNLLAGNTRGSTSSHQRILLFCSR